MSDTDIPTMIDIYALIDPRTNQPKYIGKSVASKNRLRGHINQPHSDEMAEWIETLSDQLLEPEMEILDRVPSDISDVCEHVYIMKHQKRNGLFNQRSILITDEYPFLDAVKQHGGQLAATSEVSKTLGCSEDTAELRLEELWENGELTDRRDAGGTTIWEARDDV